VAWFGKANQNVKNDVVETLRNMNGQIERDNFKIVLGPPNGNENANMLHFSDAALPGRDSIYQQIKAYLQTNPALPMTIRPQMLAMEKISLTTQSRVETFLHELSHFAAGTIDKDPPKCYDIAGVNYCKGKGAAVAVRNAENVGFFVTDFNN
jgi:hypothetical protein